MPVAPRIVSDVSYVMRVVVGRKIWRAGKVGFLELKDNP